MTIWPTSSMVPVRLWAAIPSARVMLAGRAAAAAPLHRACRKARRSVVMGIKTSFEVRREFRMLCVLKHSLNLCGRGPALGQWRQRIARKERHFAGLVAGAGRAPYDFADEKQLVDRVEMAGRPIASLVIVDGRQLERLGHETRLFGNFPHDAFGGRLIDVRPAARQRPLAIADFTHQKHAAADE